MIVSRRDPEVEEKRAILNCKIKNLVLYYLARVKASKSKTTFKEVLSNIIVQKKEAI